MVEFFESLYYGPQSPIKDMMRLDYRDPTHLVQNIKRLADSGQKSCVELLRLLDVYLEFFDGYSYRSFDRMFRTRKKGFYKPSGPSEIYRYPGTNSMNYGWWIKDPTFEVLKEDPWHKPRKTARKSVSEMSKYLDECLKIDKYFKL